MQKLWQKHSKIFIRRSHPIQGNLKLTLLLQQQYWILHHNVYFRTRQNIGDRSAEEVELLIISCSRARGLILYTRLGRTTTNGPMYAAQLRTLVYRRSATSFSNTPRRTMVDFLIKILRRFSAMNVEISPLYKVRLIIILYSTDSNA